MRKRKQHLKYTRLYRAMEWKTIQFLDLNRAGRTLNTQRWMRSNLRRLQLARRMRQIPVIIYMVSDRAVSISCWFDQEPWKGLLWYRKHCKKGDEIYYVKNLWNGLGHHRQNLYLHFLHRWGQVGFVFGGLYKS